MIYAKIHFYMDGAGAASCIQASDIQFVGSTAYNVPDVGWLAMQNGVIVISDQTASRLAQAKNDACAEIDSAAEEIDKKYTICGGQQGHIYIAKYDQAKAYKAANYPVLAEPLLPTDTNYTIYGYVRSYRNVMRVTNAAATDTDAANGIIAQGEQWLITIGVAREGNRLTGKEMVKSATTVADVYAARDATIAALQAL